MIDAASPLLNAVMITGFVAVMMIAVEYLNILSRGTFEAALRRAPWVQYLAAVALGALPGCLGAFTVVALYSHRVLSLGAVAGTMIATSGDEAFIMFALFPGPALALTIGLAALGLAVAPVVDRLAGARRFASDACTRLTLHDARCRCFPRGTLLAQWLPPSRARGALSLVMLAFAVWVVAGGPGLPIGWNWIRITLLLAAVFGGFIVATVPDHFLDEHLWAHVMRRHVPRIFAWTAGVLLAITVLEQLVEVETLVRENSWALLLTAGLIGVIPESGPHLVLVYLFAAGSLPLAILVTSSIVQDGHGMLPMLAQSRRDFAIIKAINLAVGLGIGAVMLAAA